MKYSILGFNQEKIVNYAVNDEDKVLKCDLTDLLILNYIIYAQANPKLLHENNYVWLQHEHIREDLPILNMTEGTLKNRLTKLRKMNLLNSVTKANSNGQGTKTFYMTTSFCYDMVFESTSLKNDVVDEARHSKMTSNNKQLDNKKIENTISINTNSRGLHNSFSFGAKQEKPKKDNLYNKCLAVINEFTDDAILQNMLEEFLKRCLANSRESGVPFYTNTFRGKLNKLKLLSEDNYVQRDIVRQTLDNGWNGFYEVKNTKQKRKNDIEYVSAELGIVESETYTEEELAQQREWREQMIRDGKQVKF